MTLNSMAIAATVVGAAALLSPQARADRVCKQECSAGVCKEQCVETQDRDRDRDRVTIERREERHEDRPDIEFKAPGVGVEIGH
jgi:hypothetical protein